MLKNLAFFLGIGLKRNQKEAEATGQGEQIREWSTGEVKRWREILPRT
jgi:hypothetical protein